MTVNPLSGRTSVPEHRAGTHGPSARLAVVLAAVVLAVLVVAYAIFGISYAMNGAAGVEDNWVGLLAGVALIGGLAASLIAFGLAVLARVRQQRWRMLWLPLALFPGLATVVLVLELFLLA